MPKACGNLMAWAVRGRPVPHVSSPVVPVSLTALKTALSALLVTVLSARSHGHAGERGASPPSESQGPVGWSGATQWGVGGWLTPGIPIRRDFTDPASAFSLSTAVRPFRQR